jgi:mono/diheme cytochrome c family protein
VQGWARDLSESGLGVFIVAELVVGELVTLEILLRASRKEVITVQVTRRLGTQYGFQFTALSAGGGSRLFWAGSCSNPCRRDRGQAHTSAAKSCLTQGWGKKRCCENGIWGYLRRDGANRRPRWNMVHPTCSGKTGVEFLPFSKSRTKSRATPAPRPTRCNLRRPSAVFLLLILYAAPLCAQDEAPALFNSNCAHCHNTNGDGKTAAAKKMRIPDLRSPVVQKMTDEELFQTIGNGTQHKQYPHPFLRKGMTAPQVRQLVAHIRTLKPKR